MNDIIKAMEERRSVRKFKHDVPKKEDIAQIIEAGLYAANIKAKSLRFINPSPICTLLRFDKFLHGQVRSSRFL